jgi:hypothetical protein
MKKPKYYFENEDSEGCYSETHFQQQMKDEGLTEVTVLKAVPDGYTECGYIWCKKIGATGEKGECGRSCEYYAPRNGESGMCRHQGRFYEHGEEIILKLKV